MILWISTKWFLRPFYVRQENSFKSLFPERGSLPDLFCIIRLRRSRTFSPIASLLVVPFPWSRSALLGPKGGTLTSSWILSRRIFYLVQNGS